MTADGGAVLGTEEAATAAAAAAGEATGGLRAGKEGLRVARTGRVFSGFSLPVLVVAAAAAAAGAMGLRLDSAAGRWLACAAGGAGFAAMAALVAGWAAALLGFA